MASRKSRSLVDDSQFSVVVENLSSGYKTVTELVYAVLKEAILSGAFAPGEWLRQESIAEAIGVSRIPVRTALVQLESEGMITFHPHRGARVRTLTPEQVDEIYRLRILLETYAISRVFASIDPDRLARLRLMAARLDKLPEGSDFLDLRIEFYRELYDGKNNPLLVQMIDDLRSHVGRYYLGFKFPDHSSRHHTDLVERMASGDLEGATAWLTAHFDTVRSGIRDLTLEDSTGGEASSRRRRAAP